VTAYCELTREIAGLSVTEDVRVEFDHEEGIDLLALHLDFISLSRLDHWQRDQETWVHSVFNTNFSTTI
jgi:hypothetical protein